MLGEYFWIRFASLLVFYMGSLSSTLIESKEKNIIEFTEAKTQGTTILYVLYDGLIYLACHTKIQSVFSG
jgi:hypothetical protein